MASQRPPSPPTTPREGVDGAATLVEEKKREIVELLSQPIDLEKVVGALTPEKCQEIGKLFQGLAMMFARPEKAKQFITSTQGLFVELAKADFPTSLSEAPRAEEHSKEITGMVAEIVEESGVSLGSLH